MTAPSGFRRTFTVGVSFALALTSLPEAAFSDDAAPAAPANRSVSLLVVGPDGKPVPGVVVEFRSRPLLTAENVRRGEFRKKGPYGAFVAADAEGRVAADLPEKAGRFDVSVIAAGYGPYWAEWKGDETGRTFPVEFRIELDRGWSVGGIVVGDDGKPVAGAVVHPSIKFKKPPGDRGELGIGNTIKTDAEGRWRFDSVPESMADVHVEVSHPDFMPFRMPLPRDGFAVRPGEAPAGTIQLDPGLTVTGTVTDDAGAPVAGALVRTKFLNDIREAKTGPDGVYALRGCEPMTARVVASAKGRATDLREVQIEPDVAAVDFRLPPGGKVRVRVLDEQGNPVPKARIFFQRWRGRIDYFEFDHVSQYADEQGVWTWDEAPLDEFQADICRPEGMQLATQPLVARAEEYVFRVPPALVISGRVIDKATKKPIETFRVVPGIRSSEDHMNWVENGAVEGRDGDYRVRETHDYFAYLFRVEASGYKPAVSRDVKSNEGTITLDFELEKGEDVAATLLTPDGKPAAAAKVALGVAGSQIEIKNGDLDEGSTYAARADADAEGRFRFPPQSASFQLVITHPAGYAHLKSIDGPIPATVKLTAWARVEGTFRVGQELAPAVTLTLNTETLHSYGEKEPHIYASYEVTTGADGRYAFERVVAGKARVGRRILLMVKEGATEVASSALVPVQLVAGATTRLDLGGTGRAVFARFEPPEGQQVRWSHVLVHAEADVSFLPEPAPADVQADQAKLAAWRRNFLTTDAGRAWAAANEALKRLDESSPYFTASVAEDGSFRIDDVPPGAYRLTIRQEGGRAGVYRFAVPDDGKLGPIDLGTLPLEKR